MDGPSFALAELYMYAQHLVELPIYFSWLSCVITDEGCVIYGCHQPSGTLSAVEPLHLSYWEVSTFQRYTASAMGRKNGNKQEHVFRAEPMHGFIHPHHMNMNSVQKTGNAEKDRARRGVTGLTKQHDWEILSRRIGPGHCRQHLLSM
jgi:hypothetical protein